ncbi:MAG TPA: pyridoxamine 5'-phosphate oxidase family protein [Chloroflexota bacterium]|nr:pyridoxamine 5'-phosphate oxidase family protein [Chloroflexota bacterium]
MGAIGPEARRVVEEQRLCFVATVNDDGTPNLSPKGTIGVLDDGHLIFGDIRSPRTVQNLRVRPTVELNVLDPIGRKGYRFRGTASIVDPGARFDELVDSFRARGLEHPLHCFVIVRVERAEPVISPAYDDGLTEAEIRERWQGHYADLARVRAE